MALLSHPAFNHGPGTGDPKWPHREMMVDCVPSESFVGLPSFELSSRNTSTAQGSSPFPYLGSKALPPKSEDKKPATEQSNDAGSEEVAFLLTQMKRSNLASVESSPQPAHHRPARQEPEAPVGNSPTSRRARTVSDSDAMHTSKRVKTEEEADIELSESPSTEATLRDGTAFRQWRERYGVTQSEVAEALGYTYCTRINEFENGAAGPKGGDFVKKLQKYVKETEAKAPAGRKSLSTADSGPRSPDADDGFEVVFRKWRKHHKVTQQAVADTIAYDQSSISQFERGGKIGESRSAFIKILKEYMTAHEQGAVKSERKSGKEAEESSGSDSNEDESRSMNIEVSKTECASNEQGASAEMKKVSENPLERTVSYSSQNSEPTVTSHEMPVSIPVTQIHSPTEHDREYLYSLALGLATMASQAPSVVNSPHSSPPHKPM
eukprot:Colp12_sorted_trinity150504_noHs@16631